MKFQDFINKGLVKKSSKDISLIKSLVTTADNDINAIKNTGVLPGGYSVNHYLTDPDAFFILTSVNSAGEGLKMFQRSPMETSMEPDFSTGNIRYKARERYSFGFSDWRGIYGSQGA